jgi:hypothetical protein
VAKRSDLRGRLDGYGPFLVATKIPAGEFTGKSAPQGAPEHILIVDLSNAETRSVVIFVNEFKKAVRRNDVLHDKDLSPLRGVLVSMLLKVNEAIPFIEGAYASVSAMPLSAAKKSNQPP